MTPKRTYNGIYEQLHYPIDRPSHKYSIHKRYKIVIELNGIFIFTKPVWNNGIQFYTSETNQTYTSCNNTEYMIYLPHQTRTMSYRSVRVGPAKHIPHAMIQSNLWYIYQTSQHTIRHAGIQSNSQYIYQTSQIYHTSCSDTELFIIYLPNQSRTIVSSSVQAGLAALNDTL